ncbi:hypothetical protein ACI2KL_29420 [Pseudomonas yamanorum]|uniref:hypothetical protein n=1 Tax=Pseudomonas yamanorum TaxID=515393 RepID=UPI00384AD090
MSAPTVFSPITKIFPQNRPIFLGKGAPGTEITVCQSNTGIGLAKTIVDTNGSWLVRSAVELPAGIYAFTAYTTSTGEYAANTNVYIEANVQPPTPSPPVVPPTDTITPSVPPITPSVPPVTGGTLPYGSAPIVDSPANNERLTTRQPQLSGRAAPNTDIYAYGKDYNPAYGNVKADANGNWRLPPTQELRLEPDGTAVVIVAQLASDGAGWASPWTTVTYNLSAPTSSALPYGSAPIVDSPANNERLTTRQPQLSGRAAPNTDIYAYGKDYNPAYGNVKADANGNWRLPPTQELRLEPDGTAVVIVAQLASDGAGWASPWTTVTYNLSAPTSSALPYGSAPIVDSPANNERLTTRQPQLSGRAAPNTVIYAYGKDYNPAYGNVKADANGNWRIPPTQELRLEPDGTAVVIVAQLASDGAGWASPWTTVTYNLSAPTSSVLPYGSAPIVDSPANNERLTTRQPQLSGRAAPNTDIYAYGKDYNPAYGNVKADANGNWRLPPTQDLRLEPDGTAVVIVAQLASDGASWASPWATVTYNF